MKGFVKDLGQLPQDRKKAILEGLQNKIIAQAISVRDDQPEIYLSYLESEIKNASDSMLEMIKASGQDGAILGNISLVYIWNKERKRVLMELKSEFMTQQPQSLSPEPQQISEELETPEAQRYFKKAIELGLMDNGYKWKRSKQLLAYFAEQMSKRLRLSNKLDKDGEQTTAWKPFENLFGETDLKGAKQNWMRINTKFEPTGFEEIDKVFL